MLHVIKKSEESRQDSHFKDDLITSLPDVIQSWNSGLEFRSGICLPGIIMNDWQLCPMSQLDELRNEFEATKRKFTKYLPKVDSALLEDLLRRQAAQAGEQQTYMLEVFTDGRSESVDFIREYVFQSTGQSIATYDHGTHIAMHQVVTLDILAELSELRGVLEITGEYTGGGIGTWAASHESKVLL